MTKKTELNKVDITQSIIALWGDLPQEQYQQLLLNIEVRKFKKNEHIYNLNDTPHYALFLASGKVKVYKGGTVGRKQFIRAIKPNEFFGYRAYFADQDYGTGAIALEACIVAFIPIDVLLQLMQEHFNISLYFIKTLSIEIGKSDDRTINLTQKHVRGRLAEALLFLKESYGMESDGQTLGIYLSREELSTLCNMTTSNCIRTLSAFATEKIIALDGRRIKILEEDTLHKISEKG